MKFLAAGEKVYKSFRRSRKYPVLLKFYLLGFLLLIISAFFFFNILDISIDILGVSLNMIVSYITAAAGVILILIAEIKRADLRYTISSYRLIVTKGLLRTKMDSVSYQMIVNAEAKQDFLERIFGLGDMKISTAKGQKEINIVGVSNPKQIESLIYKLMKTYATIETQDQQFQQQPRQYQQPRRYPPQYRQSRRYPSRYRQPRRYRR